MVHYFLKTKQTSFRITNPIWLLELMEHLKDLKRNTIDPGASCIVHYMSL